MFDDDQRDDDEKDQVAEKDLDWEEYKDHPQPV